jgi:hypothetical protein
MWRHLSEELHEPLHAASLARPRGRFVRRETPGELLSSGLSGLSWARTGRVKAQFNG